MAFFPALPASLALVVLLTPSLGMGVGAPKPHLREWGDGFAAWSDGCPCANESLCEPISTSRSSEDVYAFHTTGGGRFGNGTGWKHYDWSQITTICVFGEVDPALLCHAHAHGARLTLGNGGPSPTLWTNETAIDAWVQQSVAKVSAAYADGFNIDIESSQSDPIQVQALTRLTRKAVNAMRKANPYSHVTFDTPSEGESSACGAVDGRKYAYKELSE